MSLESSWKEFFLAFVLVCVGLFLGALGTAFSGLAIYFWHISLSLGLFYGFLTLVCLTASGFLIFWEIRISQRILSRLAKTDTQKGKSKSGGVENNP